MRRLLLLATTVVAASVLSLPVAAQTGIGDTLTGSLTPRGGGEVSAFVQQIGTYDYLLSPNYDGLAPLSDATRGATIGLGTFDHLDGELVILGGTMYRVPTTGVPVPVPPKTRTPFVQAVDFRPDATRRVPRGTTCADLGPLITELSGASDGVIAVRMRGKFSSLKTRSVPRQSKPYPPLSDVVAEQTEFDLDRETATLVGFWQGPSFAGIGAPGLHVHGLTADRDAGGHVLSCVTGKVRLAVQTTGGVTIHAPR